MDVDIFITFIICRTVFGKTTAFITLDIGVIAISFLAVFVFKLKERKLIMIQTLTLKHKQAN